MVESPYLLEEDTGLLEAADFRRSEVVGFVVRGRRLSERLSIDDLDTIVTPGEVRLLPLFRLLRAFNINHEEVGDVIRFSPEGVGDVVIDLAREEARLGERTFPIYYLEATSQITLKRDIYVKPELVEHVLDMEMVWNNELYEYRVDLERTLNIWKREKTASLFSIRALYVPPHMVDVLPPADPSDSLLQMVQVDLRAQYVWQRDRTRDQPEHVFTFASPREQLWGSLLGGRYKLRMSHPGFFWDNDNNGPHFFEEDPPGAFIDWAEWIRHFTSAELALGDSTVGLSDLVFPITRIAGIRLNGLTGFTEAELTSDRSGKGFYRHFNAPRTFEGTAPIGSRVELLINDTLVDAVDIVADREAPPGTGVYRFEDVRLPANALNEIIFLITEPNGQQTRVEKTIFGSPSLLPRNHGAYLAYVGQRRDLSLDTGREIELGEIFGCMSGARFMYGVTDQLTVGAVAGHQREIFRHRRTVNTASRRRFLPTESTHGGFMFVWLPTGKLLVSGDLAGSQGQGRGDYDDIAARLRAQYLPNRRLSFQLDLLHFGPDYFDGTDIRLSDRRGAEISGRWRVSRQWSVEGAAGHFRNNLDQRAGDTLIADYQTFQVRTTSIPRSTLSVQFTRLGAHWESRGFYLVDTTLRTTLLPGLDIFSQISEGDVMTLGNNTGFFSGMRLSGLPFFTRPRTSITVRKLLPKGNTVSVQYFHDDFRESVTLSHDLQLILKHPLRLHSDLVRNVDMAHTDDRFVFRSRAEYLLDERGRNTVGVEVQCRNQETWVMGRVALSDLYSFHEGKFRKVRTRRAYGDDGGVHGIVFLDYNANGVRDPGEPGVPNVRVRLGDLYTVNTQEDGYYFLPSLKTHRARVSLDMETIPAIYSVVSGTQLVNIEPGSLTEVDLSVTPLISITGPVLRVEEGGERKPQHGVRVMLIDPETGKFVADSITAQDGTYYLGNLKPGSYILKVDPKTVPEGVELLDNERRIEVVPKSEFQDLTMPEFLLEPSPFGGEELLRAPAARPPVLDTATF